MSAYDTGLHYCISAADNYDVDDLELATIYIEEGNTYLQQATSILSSNSGMTAG